MGLLSTAARTVADWVKLGYPESVAKRIVSGDLPMDEASRLKRAEEQGYGDTYLHGGSEQITELDGGMLGRATGAKTAKQAFWATKDPRTAGSYANHAAKDAPVRRKLEEAEAAYESEDWDRYDQLIDEAEALEKEVYNQPLRGQMVTPIRVKGPKAQMDARGRSFDDFGMSDEISERVRGASHDGFTAVEISDLDDAVGLYNQPADHLAVTDLEAVRSPNAAFDPEYTGRNILGGATPGMMGAVAGTAGGASAIAAMRDEVVDSLLNYSDDRAKKDADRRIPDARTIDEQRIANHRREVNERMHELGMLEDPLYTYRDFMPFKKNIVTGERSLAVPSSVRGMIRGLLDVGSTPRTGVYNPESLLELL